MAPAQQRGVLAQLGHRVEVQQVAAPIAGPDFPEPLHARFHGAGVHVAVELAQQRGVRLKVLGDVGAAGGRGAADRAGPGGHRLRVALAPLLAVHLGQDRQAADELRAPGILELGLTHRVLQPLFGTAQASLLPGALGGLHVALPRGPVGGAGRRGQCEQEHQDQEAEPSRHAPSFGAPITGQRVTLVKPCRDRSPRAPPRAAPAAGACRRR